MNRRHRTPPIAAIIVIAAIIGFLVPVYWLVNTAFKPFTEASAGYPPSLLPKTPTLDNFWIALVERGGLGSLLDSSIVAFGTLVLCLLLAIPAAYSVSRFRLWQGQLAVVILSFRFMPPVVVSVALYQISTRLGLQDTHLALILVDAAVSLPFMIWLLKGFFDELPREIEEAAAVDGASHLQILRSIVLPLSGPGLVSTALFTFVFTWNELLFALLLTDVDVRPFAKLVPGLTSGVNEPHWSALAAISLVIIVPIVLAAFYLQRFLVRGLTYGALK
jgi:multiple sugar transport system permease protein